MAAGAGEEGDLITHVQQVHEGVERGDDQIKFLIEREVRHIGVEEFRARGEFGFAIQFGVGKG